MGLADNFFGSPDQTMALGLLGAGLMRGDFGGGAREAMGLLAGAEQRSMQKKLMEAQIAEHAMQAEARKMAVEKQKSIQDMLGRLFTGGAASPAAPGQLGSGSFGAIPAPAGQPDIPAPRQGGIGGANFNDVVALHALGGPDLTNAYKYAREGIERKPGSFYEDMQGRREYIADPKTGMNYRDGQISEIPGYTPFLTAQTRATEGTKAEIASQYALEKVYNPATQREELVPRSRVLGQQPQSRAPAATMPAARPVASASQTMPQAQPGMTGNFVGDPSQVMEAISQIRDPQERANAMAAFQEQARRTKGFTDGGGFAAGPSAGEAASAAAAKAGAVKQAEADVMPDQQRKAALSSADYLTSVLDMALKHPGLPTATGMQGTLDPRNYLPGTDATNFRSVLDQIKGSAFMQAYQNLKGGGQITEVEGKKATDAIARLNTAQSTPEFVKALKEFKEVIDAGRSRLVGASQGAGPRGWSIQKVN